MASSVADTLEESGEQLIWEADSSVQYVVRDQSCIRTYSCKSMLYIHGNADSEEVHRYTLSSEPTDWMECTSVSRLRRNCPFWHSLNMKGHEIL